MATRAISAQQDKVRSAPEASVATTPLVFCRGRRLIVSSAAVSNALTEGHTHLRNGVGVEISADLVVVVGGDVDINATTARGNDQAASLAVDITERY